MVCKKNTSDLYWFGPKNALRPVGEGDVARGLERANGGAASEAGLGRGGER
jgi:hypothetical protein